MEILPLDKMLPLNAFLCMNVCACKPTTPDFMLRAETWNQGIKPDVYKVNDNKVWQKQKDNHQVLSPNCMFLGEDMHGGVCLCVCKNMYVSQVLE